jgi:hypothetical protein
VFYIKSFVFLSLNLNPITMKKIYPFSMQKIFFAAFLFAVLLFTVKTSNAQCTACPSYDQTLYPSATPQTTGTITLAANECEMFRIYMYAGTPYTFSVCSNGGTYTDDTVFEIFDASCTNVAYNDDNCFLGSELTYTPTTTGYHYFMARGFSYSACTMNVAYWVTSSCTTCPAFDFTITPTTTYQTHSNSITVGGCKKYQVNLTAGNIYTFTFCDGGATADYDTYLTLFDNTCIAVASNDDACGLLSQIIYTPTVSGTYYLEVNSCCTGSSGGNYTLAYKYDSSSPSCDYNVPFTGNNSITASSGFICDHAGWGINYSNNANGYTVINPVNPGDNVRLTFTHFQLESCCDYVNVFEGTGTSGTLLFSGNGTTLPPVLTSTAGPLTIQFTSDGSVVLQGFRAEISNVPGVSTCNFEITISGASYLDETTFTFTNSLSTVVLSGGPFSSGSTNIFTHAGVNPPYTFYLSTIGSFNDNVANYEIKLNGTVIHSGTVNGGQDITINNITCSPGPTCSTPTALNASNITHDEAQLSWTETGTATIWDIEFGTTGFIPTGIPTYPGVANPYTVTGLSPNTTYQFYVRADCGASLYSPWAGPFTFTTLQYCPAPTNVTATPTTICAGQSSNLNATAPGNTIYWYEVPTGGTEIGTSDSGVDFPVSPLMTTTYYAESQSMSGVPGSLTTTTAGGSGCGAGIMFDATANAGEITITGFDVIPMISGTQNVNLYVKSGTYVGFETNSSAWTLLGTYPINGTVGVMSNITTAPITIPAGTTSGIYLNFNAQYTALGSITTYFNSDITITSGMGHCSLFDGCCTPRGFNGTIYYETASATYYVGPVDPTFGSHDSQNFAVQSNIFDVLEPAGVTISEVDIFFTAPLGSNFTIVLTDNINTVLETYSGQITVTGGPAQTVPLNFFVPAGTSYRLAYSLNPGSMRNDAGATYPYTVPGVISITGNTFNPLYYYWFYNWKVVTGSNCISPTRTPVTVTVNDVPAQPSAITGNPAPCEGSSEMYNVTDVPGTTYLWTFPAGWSQTGGGTTNDVAASVGTTGGNIVVTPENSCGTGTPSTLSVVVNPLPVVSIIGLGAFYCDYYPAVTMTGNPTGGTFSGQGVTGNVFDPAAAGVGVWPITYTYTDANSCTNSETLSVTVDVCTSTGDDELAGLISVYPNPFKDMLSVEIQAVQSGDFIWNLYDMNGKLIQSGVYSLSLGLNTLEIQTEELSAGLYMLKSNMNGKLHSIRIVKQ